MPRDLNDLLADGAPRDPGPLDLDAIESRAARRRSGRVGAGVLAVLAAAVIAVQALPSPPEAPIIGDLEQTIQGATVLPLPSRGEVNPDHANGRPVFVVHDDDGEVRVLDAISPHDTGGDGMKVLAYCASSGWFEDPWHGSKFSDNGAWVGGPAPHGLASHEIVEVREDTVVVGGLGTAAARGGLTGDEPTGDGCGDTLTEVRIDDFLLHTDVDDDRVPGLLYPERPEDDCCGLLLREEPQASAGDEVTLDLPAPGQTLALHVDGRPAFVHTVADRDDVREPGAVVVLDAVSPLQDWAEARRVLAWCAGASDGTASNRTATHGVLVDLWSASRFSVAGFAFDPIGAGGLLPGGWGGGPAPTGVGRYAVTAIEPGTETLNGVVGGSVTVRTTPLPVRPRVGEDTVLEEGCSEHVALLPDSPPADPLISEDLVVHEPEFPGRWWYPTPERLFGDEAGLPPSELERSLDLVAADRVDLSLDALPQLGDAGLARQTALGVELLALDGTSLGTIRDTELVGAGGRDGHGGAFLVRDADGTEHWVAPSNGTTTPATGLIPSGGYVEQADGTWVANDPFLPVLDGPLHVGNGGRHVTGPVCFEDCPAPTVVDLDMGGASTTEPGCVATDGFGDRNSLEVCFRIEESSTPTVIGRFVEGERRWEVPRYAGQPDDVDTIGRFRDALFGPSGVVAQLSLECEIPAVVQLEDDGSASDPWGAETWEGGPTSTLLGSTTAIDDGRAIPLAHVVAGACGDTKGVEEGVWALTADGPQLLNDITDAVVLWDLSAPDLDAIAGDLTDREQVAVACADPNGTEITDLDLDGDGRPDRVVLDQDVVACLADGSQDRHETPPIEFARVADLGTGADVLAVGGTLVSSSLAELLLWMNGELTPVTVGCTDSCIEPEERVGATFEDGFIGGGEGAATWGCRATGDGVAFLTVRAEHGEDGVTITTVEYELSGATLDEVDRAITTRDGDGSEFVALDHLRELGATRYCEA